MTHGLTDVVVGYLAGPTTEEPDALFVLADDSRVRGVHARIDTLIDACDWLTLTTLDTRIAAACADLGVPVPRAVADRITARQEGTQP
ncbi:hypothetical protein OH540_21180 [Streptomyces sp. BPPL-273]|uniref:hypothetical protein n=1 Tax=Streptomyces sp. BPPL-273 TaxID=2987533 RepID=UPI0024AF5A1A|nr:hypothetical protein [Streptomyces sp. BPPL-273]WHM32419.1 hypothetical protein OH540_21180 [Streptomyces sp. BPPL-273]